MKHIVILSLAVGWGLLALPETSSAQIKLPRDIRINPRFLLKPKVPPFKVASKQPDLYIAGVADLTSLASSSPLSQRMWVKIGNKGTQTAVNVHVHISFWKLTTVAGKTSGKIYHTRTMNISSLNPGEMRTLYPYNLASSPIAWSVKIDPHQAIAESNETNNGTGRLWALYPDAFLRAYSYDPAP